MKNRYSREVFTNIALISQLGISMMVPIFGMLFIGIYLENKTGWFLTVPFLVLGMLGGFKCVSIIVRKAANQSNISKHQKDIEEENRLVDEAINTWNKIK